MIKCHRVLSVVKGEYLTLGFKTDSPNNYFCRVMLNVPLCVVYMQTNLHHEN